MQLTSSKTALRFARETVEHPFDTKFIPAQPDSEWVQRLDTKEEEYAWVLCTYSATEVLVWLPSCGEAVLRREQLDLAKLASLQLT